MKKLLLLSTLLIFPELSQAQIFRIKRTSSVDAGGAVDSAIDTELLRIQNEVNSDIPSASPKRLMDGMADSQALSSKGLATDYITHFDTFMIGGGVGLAADLEKDKDRDRDASGAGATGGLQFGLNMSAFTDKTILGMDPTKMSVMFNLFTFNTDQDFDESNAKAKLLSFGVMGSYKWKDGKGSRLFGWDGVRFHTGYQYTSLNVDFATTINEQINGNFGGGTINQTITASPKGGFESTSHSIPLEISSGVNFLYILSFYGGLGTDINFGSAKGNGAFAESETLTCTGGACGGSTNVDVDINGGLTENGKVQPLFLRGFAGFQVNLPYTRIYVHANNVFGTDLYSVATGLRLVF